MHKQEPKQSNTLKIALSSDISTLHFSSSMKGGIINSSHVINLLFEGLLRLDHLDVPQLAIASQLDISTDQKKYTFHLRECQWSDGTPVTAYDFEYTWKLAMDPKSKQPTTSPHYYRPIKNGALYLLGQCPPEDVGITALDAHTLVIELDYPSPYFLNAIASPIFFPAPKHIMEKDPQWATKPGLVCNGAFTLETWERNSLLALLKNPSYWDRESVSLDGIDIYIIPQSDTAFQMFEKKELDWIGDPFFKLPYNIPSYQQLEEYEERESASTLWIDINTDKYPLNNKKLRKALCYALNREELIESIFNRSALPAYAALSSPLRLFYQPHFEDNHTTLAKKLFQEALDELNLSIEELPEIELTFIANKRYTSLVAQVCQNQWREVLGITNLRLNPMEYNAYGNYTLGNEYSMSLAVWSFFVLEPMVILEGFMDKSKRGNVRNWEDEAFNKYFHHARNAEGVIERHSRITQAEMILMDGMPVIPLCSLNKRFAKNQKLKGEIISANHRIDFKSAYFER